MTVSEDRYSNWINPQQVCVRVSLSVCLSVIVIYIGAVIFKVVVKPKFYPNINTVLK